MYTPKNLKKWTLESDYAGKNFSDWYVLVSRTRDSELLEESNFECIKKDLKENPSALEDKKGLFVARFNHWACGWYESLLIHETDTKLLKKADKILDKFSDYPVYNDDDLSDRESERQYSLIKDEVNFTLNLNNVDLSNDQTEDLIYRLCRNQPDFDCVPNKEEILNEYEEMIKEENAKICKSCGHIKESVESICENCPILF